MSWRLHRLAKALAALLLGLGLVNFLAVVSDVPATKRQLPREKLAAVKPPPPRVRMRRNLLPNQPFRPVSFPPPKLLSTPEPAPPLLILDWTGYYGSPVEKVFAEQIQRCPNMPRCAYTSDREALNTSAAVLFHLGDLGRNWTDMPEHQNRRQIFVLFSMEPPPLTSVNLSLPKARNYFNWSMSYRLDSNVHLLHGIFSNDTDGAEARRKEWLPKLKAKDKDVATFASNCITDSEREVYVAVLQDHIPVDVYGTCGSQKGPKLAGGAGDCEAAILRRYRFYLAFESSVCHNYVTEKFFRYLSEYAVLPIVLNRSIMRGIAPPNSFIAADDFASPAALAAELRRLSADSAAFEAHFDWLKGQKLELGFQTSSLHFCMLCRKLDDQPKPPKEYIRIIAKPDDYWYTKGSCKAGYASTLAMKESSTNSMA